MQAPRKGIVSLLSSATEALYALGLGDRVLAVSHECDFPPAALDKPRATMCRIDSRASSLSIDAEVRRLHEAGLPIYELDRELLARLQPGLIVTQSQCDVCAVRYEDVVDTVQAIPELAETQILPLNPGSLDDILRDIQRIGQAAGCPEHAGVYVASLRRRIETVRQKTSDLADSEKPRVACIEWIEPLMLAANWMPELLHLAGAAPGRIAPGRASEYHPWSDLIDAQPEVAIVMPCGFDAPRAAAEAAILRTKPGWRDLPAVRNGRAYAVDGNALFNRAGPRIVESLELLAHLLHPARFPQSALPRELCHEGAVICLTDRDE